MRLTYRFRHYITVEEIKKDHRSCLLSVEEICFSFVNLWRGDFTHSIFFLIEFYYTFLCVYFFKHFLFACIPIKLTLLLFNAITWHVTPHTLHYFISYDLFWWSDSYDQIMFLWMIIASKICIYFFKKTCFMKTCKQLWIRNNQF